MGSKLTYFVEHEKETKGATQKMKSSECWSSWTITFFLSTEGTFFTTSSAFSWEQTVLLSLSIFFLYYYLVEFI